MATNPLQTRLQAEGIALAIKTATGKAPLVQYYSDGHVEIYFKEADIKFLREYLETALSKKPSADIRLNALPILLPVVLKRVYPLIIGLVLAGYLLRMGTVK